MDFDTLLNSAVTLTTMAATVAALAAVFVFTYLRASVGMVLGLGVLLFRVLVPESPVASVAGIDLFLADVIYMGLAVVAALRWLHIAGRGHLPLEHIVLLFLALLLLINFGRGVSAFGANAAGVELRRHFFFVSGATYFASFEPVARRTDWLLRAWIAASLVICGISLQRFAVDIRGFDFERLRVVDSNVTLVLAQAMLISLYLWVDSRNPRLYRNLALMLLPFVVIMQHRTVWVVMMASILMVLLWEARLRNRLFAVLAVGAVLTGVGMLAIYGDRGSEVLGDSASDTGTFEWRVEGWRVLLEEQLRDGWDTMFGRPMGAGFRRYLSSLGYSVDVSPHNYYIEILLVGGIVGLAMLLLIYGGSLLRLLKQSRPPERSTTANIALVLLVSQLVYFITYAPLPEQSILLGIALSMALSRSAANAPQAIASQDSPRRGLVPRADGPLGESQHV